MCIFAPPKAKVAELVDALDSKSCDSNVVRVRFPPLVQKVLAIRLFYGSLDEWLSHRSAKPSTAVRIRQEPPRETPQSPFFISNYYKTTRQFWTVSSENSLAFIQKEWFFNSFCIMEF